MKGVAFLLMLILWIPSWSQSADSIKLPSQEELLRKSESQRHLAKVFLIGGSAMMFIGMIGFNNSSGPDDYGPADTYGYLFVGGSLLDLASIPLFIGSTRNSKKAEATVGFQNHRVALPGGRCDVGYWQPGITLTIRLGYRPSR